MFKTLLLFCVSITLISIASSYVPVKGGRHSVKPKEEGIIDNYEEKHDEVIFPHIVENKDLTHDNSEKDITKSILEDINKSNVQENSHKSTTYEGKHQKEVEINQAKNDSSISHSENHHMKNGNEETHIFKEVKENFHHDEATIRNHMIYNSGANFDHKPKNHEENVHKLFINEDLHKVSMSNLDGKNVDHKHNEHFLHISNKDNPFNYHVKHHTSFDNVKIDNKDHVERDHQGKQVDIEVPFLSGALDLSGIIDQDRQDKVSSLDKDQKIAFDNFNKNVNEQGVLSKDDSNQKFDGSIIANTHKDDIGQHNVQSGKASGSDFQKPVIVTDDKGSSYQGKEIGKDTLHQNVAGESTQSQHTNKDESILKSGESAADADKKVVSHGVNHEDGVYYPVPLPHGSHHLYEPHGKPHFEHPHFGVPHHEVPHYGAPHHGAPHHEISHHGSSHFHHPHEFHHLPGDYDHKHHKFDHPYHMHHPHPHYHHDPHFHQHPVKGGYIHH